MGGDVGGRWVILHDSDRDSRRRIGGAGERNEIDRNEKCRAIGHTRIRIEAAQRAVYRSTIPAMLLCMNLPLRNLVYDFHRDKLGVVIAGIVYGQRLCFYIVVPAPARARQ